MNNFPLNRRLLGELIEVFRNVSGESGHTDPLSRYIFNPDQHDKTSVFDFIDKEWIEIIQGKMERMMTSDLYAGDGSLEHRLATIVVSINLGHMFPNGNKRSSMLALLILCLLNSKKLDITNDEVYTWAKKIAKDGNARKDESIEELCNFLKKRLISM